MNWTETTLVQKTGKKDYVNISPEPMDVRLVGKPWRFYKIFANKSACVVSDSTANRLFKEHPSELKYMPKENYAIKVINRKDGLAYIMEFKYSVMKLFGERNKIGDGPNGDWKVWKTGKGLNTRYKAIFIQPSKLTEEEKAHTELLNPIIEKNYLIKDYSETLRHLELEGTENGVISTKHNNC